MSKTFVGWRNTVAARRMQMKLGGNSVAESAFAQVLRFIKRDWILIMMQRVNGDGVDADNCYCGFITE
jgi:hypothetical protein